MERLLVIIVSAAIGTAFFLWFSRAVKKQYMQEYIMSHQWLLHPNSICYWRTAMAVLGFILYFFTPYQSIAIFIFTFAAILDGLTVLWQEDATWGLSGENGWTPCVTN